MTPILVTGATGQIGRELVRLLTQAHVPVHAFVRDLDHARTLLGAHVDLVPGDLTDDTSLDRSLYGIDTLFLLSSNPALELAAVKVAKRQNVRRIVKSSAIGFGDQPPAGHRDVEEAIKRSGLAFTILRPNAFMQTLMTYLPKLIAPDGSFALPAGDGRTAWVDIRDIAAVAATVLQQPMDDQAVYMVTGPGALSMADIADILTKVRGQHIVYRDEAPQTVRQQLYERGLGSFADFLVEHYAAVKDGGFETVSDTVTQVTGKAARTFEQFAIETQATGQWA